MPVLCFKFLAKVKEERGPKTVVVVVCSLFCFFFWWGWGGVGCYYPCVECPSSLACARLLCPLVCPAPKIETTDSQAQPQGCTGATQCRY